MEEELDFLVINSNYIFMLDRGDNKLRAIPRSKVKELIPNPEMKSKSLLESVFDYFKALEKIIAIIYKDIFNN